MGSGLFGFPLWCSSYVPYVWGSCGTFRFHPFVPFQLHHAIVVLIEKKVLPITVVFGVTIKNPTPGTSTRGIVVVVLRTFLGQKQMDKIPAPEHLPSTYRSLTEHVPSSYRVLTRIPYITAVHLVNIVCMYLMCNWSAKLMCKWCANVVENHSEKFLSARFRPNFLRDARSARRDSGRSGGDRSPAR